MTGRGDQRARRRTFGQQQRVVPAVADRLLGSSGGALHQERRVSGDRRREVLRQPRLGDAGQSEQEQRAVRGQRRHGDLDQPAIADVLGRDLESVGQADAKDVFGDRPG